tara:strand:+ start:313 stop:495 length:183 start_codon:yes stop_codon:yes gene_type:complete
MSNELKLSSVLLKCINEIGDYFEYAYTSEEDKKYVMRKIDDMTERLKDISNENESRINNV